MAGHSAGMTPEKHLQRMASSTSLRDQEKVLALFDVDHFRALRNLHGEGTSECLLRTLGRRLEYETNLAGGGMLRLGTDEFATLVPADQCGHSPEDWARRVLAAVCLPFRYRNSSFSFAATVGIANLSGQAGMAADALRCARQAVTRGKQAGGGVVTLCSVQDLAEVVERGELARDLPAAIAHGQLIPFYQPVVRLADGHIIGVEVLARWMHPKHGLLEPIAFIQIAEEHGLCSALTRSLLDQAGRDALAWPREWTFAFNATPNDLPSILEFIATTGAPGHGLQDGKVGTGCIAVERIELEVTETALMRDIDMSRRAVLGMQPFGVKIVLDDFGSGYANFKQLRQVPFSRLKIDKSFITDMANDPRAEACAQTILELAHHLGMTATAEGVECAEVANLLMGMGCDHAQGFFFGRPMPAAEIGVLVRTGRDTRAGSYGVAA